MAKPRGDSENPVSLFPFLSILACVIGTLILLITSVALSQMGSDPEEELVERVEQYRELEQKQKQMDERLETMLPKVHELEQYKEALKKLREQLEKLKKMQQADDADKLALQKLLEEQDRLEEALKKQLSEKEKLEAMLNELLAELERRRRVLDAPTVTVLPPKRSGGRRSRPDPVFVEANDQGIVLDPAGKREVVPRGKLATDAQFKQLVDQVAAGEQVLVILIRENGVASYQTADRFARTNGAHVAKLPLLGEGMLDLSRF
jgi:hypothetical protein